MPVHGNINWDDGENGTDGATYIWRWMHNEQGSAATPVRPPYVSSPVRSHVPMRDRLENHHKPLQDHQLPRASLAQPSPSGCDPPLQSHNTRRSSRRSRPLAGFPRETRLNLSVVCVTLPRSRKPLFLRLFSFRHIVRPPYIDANHIVPRRPIAPALQLNTTN